MAWFDKTVHVDHWKATVRVIHSVKFSYLLVSSIACHHLLNSVVIILNPSNKPPRFSMPESVVPNNVMYKLRHPVIRIKFMIMEIVANEGGGT